MNGRTIVTSAETLMGSLPTSPIFVVGAPRSGTTLLAAILAAHPRLSCGPETHFFAALAKCKQDAVVAPATWPEKAVDFLFSITQPGQAVPTTYGLSRKTLAADLQSREPSVAALLAAVTDGYTKRSGKARWVEKTPVHLLHVAAIRQHFPDSPIIRIVRDPRDVIASWKRTWNVPFLKVLLWLRRLNEQSQTFFRSDALAYTVHYENLVREPRSQLDKLCDSLGERFDPSMLDTSGSIRHVNRLEEPWKVAAGRPIDVRHLGRWTEELSFSEQQMVGCLLGDYLAEHGYPPAGTRGRLAQLIPDTISANDLPLIDGLARREFRIWARTGRERAKLTVYRGSPEQWLRGHRSVRWRRLGAEVLRLVSARIRRASVIWLPGAQHREPTGRCARLLAWLLRRTRVPSIDSLEHAATAVRIQEAPTS